MRTPSLPSLGSDSSCQAALPCWYHPVCTDTPWLAVFGADAVFILPRFLPTIPLCRDAFLSGLGLLPSCQTTCTRDAPHCWGSPLHTIFILFGFHHSALDQHSYQSPLYSFFTLPPLMALGISCSERKGREGKGRERKERGRGAATLTNLFSLSPFLLSVFLSFLPSFLCSQNRETS